MQYVVRSRRETQLNESDRSERIDPGRSMRLLWGLLESPSRGPKQRLAVEDVVSTAIEIADQHGLEALSMRRVAERLGVGVMTLYTYVQAKSELLDLMFDRVVGETRSAKSSEAGQSFEAGQLSGDRWRQKLEAIARENWALRHRHRWLQEIPWTRTPLGPNALDRYEEALSTLTGLGLTGKEMTEVLNLINSYVAGAARTALESVSVSSETGINDTDWWAEVSPVLEQVWDAVRFPTLSSSELQGAWDQPGDDDQHFLVEGLSSFEFGLARVLDGIEAFVNSQRQP